MTGGGSGRIRVGRRAATGRLVGLAAGLAGAVGAGSGIVLAGGDTEVGAPYYCCALDFLDR
jgi:hypothetical protein